MDSNHEPSGSEPDASARLGYEGEDEVFCPRSGPVEGSGGGREAARPRSGSVEGVWGRPRSGPSAQRISGGGLGEPGGSPSSARKRQSATRTSGGSGNREVPPAVLAKRPVRAADQWRGLGEPGGSPSSARKRQSAARESNPQPPLCKRGALPVELPAVETWGTRGSPTGPLLCARRSESAPGVPAGKAGLRPRSSVHEAPSVLPGVTGSHCVGLKSERRQQDSNLRAPERLRASNALPCHLGHASVRASRHAPCRDARRIRRCAKRKERESNPQGPQAHPFSRRDTAPMAVLPRSSLVPVVHACRVRGRRPASPAGRPRTGPRCRAQKEGARGGTMVPPRQRRDTAPVAVLPRVTPAGVEPATARVRVGSSAELSYGASMWPAGVEPAAPRVSGGRSTGLSYGHEMGRVIHAQRCRGRRPALPAGRPDARSLRHVRKEGRGNHGFTRAGRPAFQAGALPGGATATWSRFSVHLPARKIDADARARVSLWHVRLTPNDVVQATRLPFDPGSPAVRLRNRRADVLRGGALEPEPPSLPKNRHAKADAIHDAIFSQSERVFLSQAGPRVKLAFLQAGHHLSNPIDSPPPKRRRRPVWVALTSSRYAA